MHDAPLIYACAADHGTNAHYTHSARSLFAPKVMRQLFPNAHCRSDGEADHLSLPSRAGAQTPYSQQAMKMGSHQVTPFTKAHWPQALETSVRAFADDPVATYFFPDVSRRSGGAWRKSSGRGCATDCAMAKSIRSEMSARWPFGFDRNTAG